MVPRYELWSVVTWVVMIIHYHDLYPFYIYKVYILEGQLAFINTAIQIQSSTIQNEPFE